jgi:hypothetical protein
MQAPGVDVLAEFLFETLEAFGVFSHSAAICLKDDVLRWCGTNHLGEPPQVSRAPIGPACVTDILTLLVKSPLHRLGFALNRGLA